MALTYDSLATTTLGSATASVTFSSISGSYTDLVLICNVGTTANGNDLFVRIGNGTVDSGSNYSATLLGGDGTSAASARQTNQSQQYLNYKTNTSSSISGNAIVHFNNYSNTTTNKTFLVRGNNANYGTDAFACLWRSTSAINIITITAGTSTFLSGSTFALYGIKAA